MRKRIEPNLTPKTISIKAKNITFSKLYDGNKKVVGAPTEEGTDMYKFAHGNGEYYELSGFVDGIQLYLLIFWPVRQSLMIIM